MLAVCFCDVLPCSLLKLYLLFHQKHFFLEVEKEKLICRSFCIWEIFRIYINYICKTSLILNKAFYKSISLSKIAQSHFLGEDGNWKGNNFCRGQKKMFDSMLCVGKIAHVDAIGKLAGLYKEICTKEQNQNLQNPECKSVFEGVTTDIRKCCVDFNNLVNAVKVHLPRTAAKARPKKKADGPTKDEIE